MAVSLHELKPADGARSRSKRIGRGEGSGKGKTSGRGMKGQRARSGGKSGLKLKGMKQMLLRIPKKRGFNSGRIHPSTITLSQLDRWFENGTEVTVKKLKAQNLIPSNVPTAKVVNTGKLTKALTLVGLLATPKAADAIQAAGGTLQEAAKKEVKKSAKQKVAKKTTTK
ncbi:50S ribosomal protein L15 [Candidatus Uhrbacteria bacterium]|nr:50S ribosomal protein L15 [Candidatus Uhrbacteria bacterium]MBD3284392.1 50S ribosomal protein L15 [Candidatus Uhrbacteria bacterium]